VAEEYCWAITQAAGRSCCGSAGSVVLEFRVQLDSLLQHIYTQFRFAPDLPKNKETVQIFTDKLKNQTFVGIYKFSIRFEADNVY
jgi:hypothetical protein